MSEDLHHIDDIFKNGLEGKEDNPSPKVWENIEKELDQKKSKRPFLFFTDSRKIAAILLISLASAALFAGGYFLRGFQMKDDKELQNTPVIEKNIPRPEDSREAAGSTLSSGTTEQSSVMEDHDADSRVETSERNELEKASTSASSGKSSPDATTSTLSGKPSANSEGVANAERKTTSTSRATAPKPLAKNPAPTKKTFPSTRTAVPVPGSSSGRVNETQRLDQAKQDGALSKKDRGTDASRSSARSSNISASVSSSDISATQTSPDITHEFAPLPTTFSNRDIATEKQLPTSSQAFSNNELAAATIPVLNKKQGSVNLPRFTLTPVVALQFGSNRIKANSGYANSGKVKEEMTRTESQPSSIAGGILADLKISRNMTLQSGLLYTSRTIQIDPKNIIAERNPDGKVRYRFDCSAGTYFIKKSQGYTRPGDTAMTKFSTNDLSYLNIPLGLTYHFSGSTWHAFVMAGTGLNLLTRQYLETGLKYGYYDEEDTKVTNLKNSYVNGSLGAGIIWSPFKKISFTFSPQYQFGLSPINTNMPVKAYPRIFNIQTGMQIRL